MAAEIGVPTMRGVQNGVMDYGAGLIAGLVYNTVATFTGSGLIGGAISAGLASAVARGNLATAIAAWFVMPAMMPDSPGGDHTGS